GAAGLGREQQRADRARKKAQDALQKRQRREAAQALRLLRPEQCLKYVAVCVHPGLLEDPGSDALIEALSSLECSYCIEPQAVPYSITWRRNIPHSLSSTDGPTMKSEEEKEVLVLVDPRDFLKRLFSVFQSLSGAPSDSRPDLSQVLPLDGPEGPPTKNCSLAVIGLDAYRWYNRGWDRQQALCSGEQGQQEDPRFQPCPELSMTKQEIEEVLVVLQLWANTMVSFLDTWQEFSQHVSALTKAIAKRPYKKQRETELFSFCTDGKWSSGVRVEKDGTGLRQAWKRQIQQFNRVSPAAAAAIAEFLREELLGNMNHVSFLPRYNRGWDRQQALCSGEQGQQEDPRFQPCPELSMTKQEIEEVLVVLQLWANTMVSFLDTWQEFSQHVSALTKAIAKRPYKKQRETELFSFCTDGKWSSGVRVEKDGTGLRQAWKRQIQQFNRVSPAAAAAIAEAYPSPSLLLQAYEECSTENDRLHLLSDIQVKPEDGGRERRIGPDISRRVYLFMVSTSPDLVLDLSA
ncbi:probable crossover junction endonuclease EME2, partial [Alligator sinensis]|uniref:Probable crossover junction endonuclease EME2 n=1 Tax=Alligator sinensis TaxID=38654 RepID=A0A3Q0GIB1_ALLSI